tara:strand:- start:5113 stop:5343 length:231 start_codon:yes stop_codon:yes gene_type:complete
MTEAFITAVVAVITAGAALNNRLHNRINHLHERLNILDRRVAADYVSKKDLTTLLQRMEDHMVRIENKLDQIALRN